MADSAVVVSPGRKRRGWLSVGAGVFLVVMMAGLWIFLGGIRSSMDITPTESAAFFGQLHVGFVGLALCGILGIFNGLQIVRTGRINAVLTILTLMSAGASIYVLYGASKTLP